MVSLYCLPAINGKQGCGNYVKPIMITARIPKSAIAREVSIQTEKLQRCERNCDFRPRDAYRCLDAKMREIPLVF